MKLLLLAPLLMQEDLEFRCSPMFKGTQAWKHQMNINLQVNVDMGAHERMLLEVVVLPEDVVLHEDVVELILSPKMGI